MRCPLAFYACLRDGFTRGFRQPINPPPINPYVPSSEKGQREDVSFFFFFWKSEWSGAIFHNTIIREIGNDPDLKSLFDFGSEIKNSVCLELIKI